MNGVAGMAGNVLVFRFFRTLDKELRISFICIV